MTIYQPEDKTLTKERIETILMLANHIVACSAYMSTIAMVDHLNDLPNLKGFFAISEKGEIVFVAQ